MIVHPDFLDHWKTQKLIKLTGDPASPLILLRLWGYCQVQKMSSFDNPLNLAAICRSSLPTDRILEILIDCNFVRMDGQTMIVHDWERSNRLLRASWNNGQKGGNPSKFKPTGYPRDAHRQPTGHKKEENRIEKVGYPRADALGAHNQSADAGLSETEKPDPEARKVFGQLLSQTAAKLRAGQPIVSDSKIL